MGTVHQFPVAGNPATLEPAQALVRALRRVVDAAVGTAASFQEREAAALALSNEATRLFLRDDLVAIADRHGEEVEVDGRIYKRHEPGTVRYYTLCGSLDLERWTYREVGVGNGPTIVPLDLDAGVVEGTTPALGYRIALGYAKDHMRSCEEDMQADHRCPPSRSTLERTAKAIGTAVKQVTHRIEPRLRQAERVPDAAVAIALGVDRTAVPMEEACPRGEAPATRRKRRRRRYIRTPPDPITVTYRMAYVGTVSFYDAEGQELSTRRYAAAAHESPTACVVSRMMADLRHALRQAPALAVGVIQDGAPELWQLLRSALAAEPLVTTYHEAIDRYHLNERLGDILRGTEPEATRRAARLSQWNDSLDHNDQAIYRIREFVRTAYAAAITQNDLALRDQLDPHVTYLENNAYLMKYARLRDAGLPVGSGVNEGSCKSLIKKRTNNGGQRWHPEGLEAVLTLRAVQMSERLPRFWAHFARAYRKEVTRCA